MEMTALDQIFLRQAISLARHAREQGEFPFGALLVLHEQVVQEASDQSLSLADPTAHAELVLISTYCREHQTLDLVGCTLYSSSEPCLMCSGAIKWARVSRVVFSVSQAMLQSLTGGRPKPGCAELVNTGNRRIQVDGPWLPEEGLAVFDGFDFTPKRNRLVP
jgi:tRNA(Arg) A34 adenosine deaminase TadA